MLGTLAAAAALGLSGGLSPGPLLAYAAAFLRAGLISITQG
jgi:hypothetical protein